MHGYATSKNAHVLLLQMLYMDPRIETHKTSFSLLKIRSPRLAKARFNLGSKWTAQNEKISETEQT